MIYGVILDPLRLTRKPMSENLEIAVLRDFFLGSANNFINDLCLYDIPYQLLITPNIEIINSSLTRIQFLINQICDG